MRKLPARCVPGVCCWGPRPPKRHSRPGDPLSAAWATRRRATALGRTPGVLAAPAPPAGRRGSPRRLCFPPLVLLRHPSGPLTPWLPPFPAGDGGGAGRHTVQAAGPAAGPDVSLLKVPVRADGDHGRGRRRSRCSWGRGRGWGRRRRRGGRQAAGQREGDGQQEGPWGGRLRHEPDAGPAAPHDRRRDAVVPAEGGAVDDQPVPERAERHPG